MGILTRIGDAPRDFMAQDEGKRVAGGDAIESKSDIRVTHAATCYLNHHFIGFGFANRKFAALQGSLSGC
jgi:hypothetical protein